MIRVLLQCDDSYFTQAFSSYTSANCQNIEFICFTMPDKALRYISEARLRLDAVLAPEAFLDQLPDGPMVKLQIDEKTIFSSEESMHINIYQAGRAILSDIRSALNLAAGGDLMDAGQQGTGVTAVYSVQGGSGKTVLAYGLAAAAARKGKKVMYLNLEPFPAFEQLYSQEFSTGLDLLLYALKSGQDLAPVVLDTMERNRDQVMVLPPARFAGDLLSLTEDEVKKLLQVLTANADLEQIIVDLPTGFQPINQWVLEQSTTILQVYTDNLVGREHLNRAQEDLYFQNLPLKAQTLVVLNRCLQKSAEPGVAAKIPQSDSLQQGQRVADVQEKNPAFLKSCLDLLEQIV